MFTASTLAGWTDIMETSTDIVGIDQHPSEYANAPAAIYWVLFVFLNAFFITNLFVGVLVDYIAQVCLQTFYHSMLLFLFARVLLRVVTLPIVDESSRFATRSAMAPHCRRRSSRSGRT
jgi:hypothetical protein